MPYGVTANGFVAKDIQTIKAEQEETLRAIFGNEINLLSESVFGQIVGVMSEREATIWEALEDVYNSMAVESSTGVSLDNILSQAGLTRLNALPSTLQDVYLFGTVSTVIPEGTTFSVPNSNNAIFQTDEEVTLIAGTDEVQDIDFDAVPDSGNFKLSYSGETTAVIAYNASAAAVQTALNNLTGLSGVTVSGDFTAGFTVTFAGDDGKQPQPALGFSDNNLLIGATPVVISIAETTPGVNQGTVNCTCTSNGPIPAAARTVTRIDNPVSGLTRIFNPTDADEGRNIETDAEARIRKNLTFQITNTGTIEGIKQAILDLNDDTSEPITIESVFVEENVSDVVVGGLAPHSIHAVVYQEDGSTDRDADIREAISSKAAGIETNGAVSGVVVDSMGVSHTIKFDRPTSISIYLILDLTVDSSDYPSDGDTQISNLILAWGNALGVGKDVIVHGSNSLESSFTSIPGITDIVVKVGTAPDPTLDNNIAISNTELSLWDSSRITVNS